MSHFLIIESCDFSGPPGAGENLFFLWRRFIVFEERQLLPERLSEGKGLPFLGEIACSYDRFLLAPARRSEQGRAGARTSLAPIDLMKERHLTLHVQKWPPLPIF